MSKTLEQTRAEYSYRLVEIISTDKTNTIPKDKFKSLVKKAPTLILTNGFGNTMAFLFSKGNPEHLALAYIIGRYLFEVNEHTKWIFNRENLEFYIKINSPKDFIEKKQKFENFLISLENIKKEIYKLNEQLKKEKKEEGKQKIENDLANKNKENKEYENKLKEFKDNFEDIIENGLFEKIKERNFSKSEIVNILILNPIFQNLVFTETDKYILATEETLRLLNWLRRFVDAMIEDEKGSEV